VRDLIIGMASGYTNEQLKPFVNSLERHYDGEYFLIRQNPYNVHPILSRFDLIPKFLDGRLLRYVIAVDTSDVVFQSNPMIWLEKNLGQHQLCVVSEHTTFAASEGNSKNMQEAFPENWEEMKDREVCNAGVIAGTQRYMSWICQQIYLMCLTDNRINAAPIKQLEWHEMISDQSALNICIKDMKEVLIAKAEDNFVHNYSHPGKGENACILHQYLYDRAEEIRQKYS
jgi:hypothetical protein